MLHLEGNMTEVSQKGLTRREYLQDKNEAISSSWLSDKDSCFSTFDNTFIFSTTAVGTLHWQD